MANAHSIFMQHLNRGRCIRCAAPLPAIGPFCHFCQRPRYVVPVKQQQVPGSAPMTVAGPSTRPRSSRPVDRPFLTLPDPDASLRGLAGLQSPR